MLRHFKPFALASLVGLIAAVGCGDETTNNSTTQASSNEGGAPAAVRLAGEGESCRTTSDCDAEFVCIAATCVQGPSSNNEGGDGNVSSAPLGKLGESCEKRADCAKGLACINEECSVADYPLKANAKQCVEVECDEDNDCCTPSSSSCGTDTDGSSYQYYCKYYTDLAVTYPADYADDAAMYCAAVKFYCECEGWTCSDKNVCERACEAEAECGMYNVSNSHNDSVCDGAKCVECLTVDDCSGGVGACVQNRCVECKDDGDCGDGQTCSGNVCSVRECYTDAHCDVFEKCNATGQCVEDECTTDRECAEYTDSGNAKCVEGDCRVPCVTDAECNPEVGGSAPYFDELCEAGYCVKAGCETAADCRARDGGGLQGNYSCVAP